MRMADGAGRRKRLISRRALGVGLALALVTQAAWVVPYYLVTNGCFCSHGGGPMPSWAGPWIVPYLEIGTLPATAFLTPTGHWTYVTFNALFWIGLVLALSAVLGSQRRSRPSREP
jgi:hypothetical protein